MWKKRLEITLKETGVRGVARRSARAGLLALRDAADVAQKRLRFIEGAARVPANVRLDIAKNAAFRGLHAGKPAFVVGAGPSLRDQDLSSIGDSLTFGCSSMFRHPYFVESKLDYYGIIDWAYFDNPDVNAPFFEDLNRIQPDTQFFMPAAFHDTVRRHGWLPTERTYFVPLDGEASDLPWDDIDLSFVPATPNSLQFCLVVALYMGCDPVVLLGADHDWLKESVTDESLATGHWNQKEAIALSKQHVHGGDFADYQDLAGYVVRLWQGYKEIHKVALRRGQRILNATPGSFLDVFPYVDLARLPA